MIRMLRNRKLIGLVLVACATLLTREMLSAPAAAQAASPAPAYTVAQLVDGIVYQHGVVADRLGQPFVPAPMDTGAKAEQQRVETALLARLAANPALSSALQTGLQSGNPYRVKAALDLLAAQLTVAGTEVLGDAGFTARINAARAKLGLPPISTSSVQQVSSAARTASQATTLDTITSADGDNDTDFALDLETTPPTPPPTPTPGPQSVDAANAVSIVTLGAALLAVLLVEIVPSSPTLTSTDDYVAFIASRLAE